MLLEMDDNTLIAMSLREHAQTCEEIAAKCAFGSESRGAWGRRAERCRDIARRYETAAKVERVAVKRCTCGDAMRAIGEHREGCPARGQA